MIIVLLFGLVGYASGIQQVKTLHPMELQVNSLDMSTGGFCGLSQSVIENYLTPPEQFTEFVSATLGLGFGIGSLSSAGDACKNLGKMLGSENYAYLSIDHTDKSTSIANKTVVNDLNYKKCVNRKGKDCEKEKMAGPVGKFGQSYLGLADFVPICLAIRPCDNQNKNLLIEGSAGIYFSGDGLPVLEVPFPGEPTCKSICLQLFLKQLAVSTEGELSTSFDDLPSLLDHGGKPLGMHVWIEGTLKVPLVRTPEPLIDISAQVGVGLFGMLTYKDGSQVKSPAQLLSKLFEAGMDVNSLIGLVGNVKTIQFQMNGSFKGGIELHLENLFKVKGMPSLTFNVDIRGFLDVVVVPGHLDQSYLSWSHALKVETDLRELLEPAGAIGKAIPSAKIWVENKMCVTVCANLDISVMAYFEAGIQLDCGEIQNVVKVLRNLLTQIQTIPDIPVDPLVDMLKKVDDFLDQVCGKTVAMSFQVQVDKGYLVPEETYMKFVDFKLTLAQLPSCPKPTGGMPPSNLGIEHAHDSSMSRCSKNSDCASGSYCLNDPHLFASVGCLGRCIPKLEVGQDCSKDRLNINPALKLDFMNAEHTACKSNACHCGFCADGNGKAEDFKPCVTNNDCKSDWCERDPGFGCGGKCKPRRANGVEAYKGWDESCQSNKELCHLCVASWTYSIPNGKSCTKNDYCQSNWCEGDFNVNCGGTCRARRANGVAAYKGWDESCQSNKELCGICVASWTYSIPNGKHCTKNNYCQSDWCEGDVNVNCGGTCRARRANGVAAYKGWDESCLSNKELCGTCVGSWTRQLPRGHSCTKDDYCQSNSCGSWWQTCWNCGCSCN